MFKTKGIQEKKETNRSMEHLLTRSKHNEAATLSQRTTEEHNGDSFINGSKQKQIYFSQDDYQKTKNEWRKTTNLFLCL